MATISDSVAVPKSLRDAAYRLASINHDYEDTITRTYWFPTGESKPLEGEIRLVHIDPEALNTNERVMPFYFGSSVTDGEFTPRSAIALIVPDQEKNLPLPEGWGDWSDAEVWDWSAT